MGITRDDIIQVQSGSFNATSGTISLPSGTTDGNTVLVCLMPIAALSLVITGFTRGHGPATGTARAEILYKAQVTAGENNWTLSGLSSAAPVVWVAMEVQHLSELNLIEAAANPVSPNLTGTSIASNTTLNPSYSYETLSFCIHAGQNTASATVPTFTGHTNNFIEYATSSRVDGATALAMSVSVNTGVDIGSYQCTATSSVSLAAANALIVTFNADEARRVPNIDVMAGMEWGTGAGRATGVTAGPPFDSTAGTVSVVTTSPRTGSYCLELSGAAAAANVAWTTTGAMSLYPVPSGFTAHRQYVARFSFYMPTLPGADVTIAAIDNGSGTSGAGAQIVYRSASQKIGVQIADSASHVGTEQLSATTVTAAGWHDVDIYIDMTNQRRETLYHAYWQFDGVAQTDANVTTSLQTSADTFTQFRLGWIASSTATIRYDDVVGSKQPGHYPLGGIKIYPLTVDTSGTTTVTTASSFSTFTANGTLNSTFSTATAASAVDEVPPTIGASADGFVQDTAATTDFVEVPMTTRSLPANLEAPRGLRWYFCGWANTAGPTTAATIGLRGYDGTSETVLFAAAEPNFQNSTTAPAWICRMHKTLSSNTPYILTQAQIDALTARVGFSSDSTPVVGVHAIIAELAVRPAVSQQVIETDGVFVYALLDPDTSNVVALQLVAPSDGDALAIYVVNGATVNRTAPAGTTDLYVIGAEANSVVSFWSASRA